MKKETLLLLLLIFSASLLIPLSEQKQSVNVIPLQELSVVYNLHNPTLQLTTDKLTNIVVNINKVDETGKESKIIINQGTLEDKLEFNDLDPGLYQITFFSADIVRVEIQGRGLYFSNMIIIGILILLNLVILYLKYNED